jgi:hypothetical protein
VAGSQLPQRLTLIQTQQRWAAILNPVIGNPMTNPGLLTGISVVTGQNVINHLLGQIQQGWIITDIDSNITLYRSAAFNDKTLTLTASGPATISLAVF